MTEKEWLLYILNCRGNRLYTGITNDLENRLKAHREGRGSRFVRAFRPFELAGVVSCENATAARKLERSIKKMSRARKLELIDGLLHTSEAATSILNKIP